MALYHYRAVDINNKKTTGIRKAADIRDLGKKLKLQDMFLLSGIPIRDGIGQYHLQLVEVADFCFQISSMLSSGITAKQSLETLSESNYKPQLQELYKDMVYQMEKGSTLGETMQFFEVSFPILAQNMFLAGEESGKLAEISEKMADYYEKENRLVNKILSAMAYPVFLMMLSLIAVLFLFLIILPQFFEIFNGIGLELPFITILVIETSQWVSNHVVHLFVGGGMGVVFLFRMWRTKRGRTLGDQVLLRLPLISNVLQLIYSARFSRTLGFLYESGLSMIKSLEIASQVLGNRYLEIQLKSMIAKVEYGTLLSSALSDSKIFHSKMVGMVRTGEESGQLSHVLLEVSKSLDIEAEQKLEVLVRLIEPVLLLTMAIIIGGIMLSVFIPLMNLYQSVGMM